MSHAGGEPEPRRSVRATKGQHKALDQLDAPVEPPKKRGGRKKKQQEEEPEEEVIRCVCGATEQDEDSDQPWIACDKCGVWQHNVCMGMSIYTEDLSKNYYCELCSPQDHKDLLDGLARGDKPWEERRREYEEEEKKNKKRKGGRKGKRASDPKSEERAANGKTDSPAPSPAPDGKREKDGKRETTARPSIGKRKAREDSQDKDNKTPAQKLRKVSATEAVPVIVDYTPPADLAAKISELPSSRQGSAKLLHKSLDVAIAVALKKGSYTLSDGTTTESLAERLALQIERALHDTHPNQKEYGNQARSLGFNLKSNQELCDRLLNRTLAPPGIAVMTSDELATKELQKEMAEMKEKAEKQSILISDPDARRVRRTHKGEELVEQDSFVQSEEIPTAPRRGPREPHPRPLKPSSVDNAESGLRIDTQHSPKQPGIDINEVFSNLKSPKNTHIRRPSQPVGLSNGPGFDPDVDRLLQEDNDSPPYSPTDESDPDVVWRGSLAMNGFADFNAAMRWVAGANIAKTAGIPWQQFVPRKLTVAGRIDQQKAVEYICSLRYNDQTDVVVTSLTPSADEAQPQFEALFNYFTSKKRYGVFNDRGVPSVRDTYLVPVSAGEGEGSLPEFMLNFADNIIPTKRLDPMLLVVFVYRHEQPPAHRAAAGEGQSPSTNTPMPVGPALRQLSISGPAFSPASPQGAFGGGAFQPATPSAAAATASGSGSGTDALEAHRQRVLQLTPAQREQAQLDGVRLATEVLGSLVKSPTTTFILPQAWQMTRNEWEIIKDIFETDSLAQTDLEHLSKLLEERA